MCFDYEILLEEEQVETIEKEKKIIQQNSEFKKDRRKTHSCLNF